MKPAKAGWAAIAAMMQTLMAVAPLGAQTSEHQRIGVERKTA
jgi:hypothetical protein